MSHKAIAITVGIIAFLMVCLSVILTHELVQRAQETAHLTDMNDQQNARIQQAIDANKSLASENDELQASFQTLQKQNSEIQSTNQRQADQLERDRQQAQTMAQQIELITKLTGIQPKVETSPAGDQQAVLSPLQVSQAASQATQCAECKASLQAAQSEKGNLQSQVDDLTRQSDNLQETVKNDLAQIDADNRKYDALITAYKGGTLFHRVKRDLGSGTSAAAGAGIGALLCSRSSPAAEAGCAAVGGLIGFVASKL